MKTGNYYISPITTRMIIKDDRYKNLFNFNDNPDYLSRRVIVSSILLILDVGTTINH